MIDLSTLSPEDFKQRQEKLNELKQRLARFSMKTREFSIYLEEMTDIDKAVNTL